LRKKQNFLRVTKRGPDREREVIRLPGVYMGDSDTFDYSLRKFKKQVEKAGILSELKKRQHFEKPSIQKKKKEAAAKKRLMKKIRKLQVM
jgi:small subunit ribosomal protein S21